jgi:hypothetical protein
VIEEGAGAVKDLIKAGACLGCCRPLVGFSHVDLGDDEGVCHFLPVNYESELKGCEHDGGGPNEPDRYVLDVHIPIVDVSGLDDVELFFLRERRAHVDEHGYLVKQGVQGGDILGGHPVPLLLREANDLVFLL